MQAKADFEIEPLRVPNYVKVKNRNDMTIHVSQLDDETLEKLLEQFKQDLWKNAREKATVSEMLQKE